MLPKTEGESKEKGDAGPFSPGKMKYMKMRYREIIGETKPYFTHHGAEEIVTKMKGDLDRYAAQFGVLADKV